MSMPEILLPYSFLMMMILACPKTFEKNVLIPFTILNKYVIREVVVTI